MSKITLEFVFFLSILFATPLHSIIIQKSVLVIFRFLFVKKKKKESSIKVPALCVCSAEVFY